MGAENHAIIAKEPVVMRRRLGREHVEPGAGEPTVFKGRGERLFVNESSAGGVYHHSGGLQLGKLSSANQSAA
jgi:hypothetical protein